jgi:hypothetical protein
MQPESELVAPLLGVLICADISPLFERGADEALGLAVGARRVGTGEAVFNGEPLAYSGKETGTISGPVVCQQG